MVIIYWRVCSVVHRFTHRHKKNKESQPQTWPPLCQLNNFHHRDKCMHKQSRFYPVQKLRAFTACCPRFVQNLKPSAQISVAPSPFIPARSRANVPHRQGPRARKHLPASSNFNYSRCPKHKMTARISGDADFRGDGRTATSTGEQHRAILLSTNSDYCRAYIFALFSSYSFLSALATLPMSSSSSTRVGCIRNWIVAGAK